MVEKKFVGRYDRDEVAPLIEGIQTVLEKLREALSKEGLQQVKTLRYNKEPVGTFTEKAEGDKLKIVYTKGDFVDFDSRPFAWLKKRLGELEAVCAMDSGGRLMVDCRSSLRGEVLKALTWAAYASANPKKK